MKNLPPILLLLFPIALFALFVHASDYQYGHFGSIDFIEYWSAGQLWLEGLNPYDPALLFPIQKELSFDESAPLMMWNPPWIFLLLAPLLSFSFASAAALWFWLNITLVLALSLIHI